MENYLETSPFYRLQYPCFILIGIFSILFLYAQDAISEFGFDFLFNDVWEVDEDDEDLGVFGGLIPIIGTMLS